MNKNACKSCRCCGGSGVEPVAKSFRKRRECAGLSQSEMAGEMGISAQFLCDLEHGRRRWDAELIEKFEKALRKKK